MTEPVKTHRELLDALAALSSRMREADETLRAIRTGEVDGLIVQTKDGDKVFTLSGANHPYRIMVETMNEGAVTLDADGMILFCNQRFADIIGEPLENEPGSSIYDYIASTDRQLFEALLGQGIKGNSKAEISLKTRGEDSIPALLSISALWLTDMPGAACMVVTDLREQKRNEEILAEEKLTTQLLHQASEIFILCDARGRIIRASESTHRLLGRSPILQEFDTIFHLRNSDGTPFALVPAMNGKPLQGLEVSFRNENNAFLSFLLSANLVDSPKTTLGIVVVMLDHTRRKKLEEALRKHQDTLEHQVQMRTADLVVAREEAERRKQIAETALSQIEKLKNQLEAERAYLQDEIKLEYNHENMIGQSDGLKYVLFKIEQIAQSDTIVLALGETGTGKELVARAIHNLSPRRNRPLVKVNCATLSANLIESELFGHEKGSFTGSLSKHLGRFEVANGSTLFLDEIGELPVELQAKLLRVIQDGEFERIGSSRTIKVDTRIIVATNRNLEAEVQKGNFREDLWYRLNVFPITMPPLRDRKDDIPLLVYFFIKKISRRMGKTIEVIPAGVMDALQNYDWPGNIRELENVLERAAINSSGPKLRLADNLKKPFKDLGQSQSTLETVERDHIIRVLEQAGGKVGGKNGAAEVLGLNRSTLRARMRKLNIGKP